MASRSNDLASALADGAAALAGEDLGRAEAAYRRAVELAPDHEPAWDGVARVLARRHGFPAAVQRMADLAEEGAAPVAAVRVAARMLAQARERDRALKLVTLAVGRGHREPETMLLRAILLRDLGQLAEAGRVLGEALAAAGERPDLLRETALVRMMSGDPAGAARAIARAIELAPADGASRGVQTRFLLAHGTLLERDAAARAWVAAAPQSIDAHHSLAMALVEGERYQDALPILQALVAARPKVGQYHTLIASVLGALDRLDEALASARRGVELTDGASKSYFELASVLERLDRYEEAQRAARSAVERDRAIPEARELLIRILLRLGREEEAERDLRMELATIGEAPEQSGIRFAAAFALAKLLWRGERLEEARRLFDLALAIRPQDPVARTGRATVAFAMGDLKEAWKDYRWRWRLKGKTVARPFAQPIWDGRPTDRKLLVWTEQGIGDHILGLGLLAEAAARCGGVVLECQERLVPLVRRSLPQIATVVAANPPDPATRDPAIGAQCAIADLGIHLRPDLASFPTDRMSYLQADPDRRATLRAKYLHHGGDQPGHLLIGISWRSTNPFFGHEKSLHLADLAPILRLPNATFVTLQHGDIAAEVEEARRAYGPAVLHDRDIDPVADIDGLAAQAAAMDLVVTTSNSTAHLAGALGCPTWILLPQRAGRLWYWALSQGDRSPWYPSARIFGGRAGEGWPEVIADIAGELEGWASERPARPADGGTARDR